MPVKIDQIRNIPFARRSSNAIRISAVLGVILVGGCDDRNHTSSARVSFVTEVVPIEFSFPAAWYENTNEHPYDLQCLSRDERLNTGVFVFPKADLAAGTTPLDIFWEQVNDLKGKRKNFEELESLQTHEYADKTITSISYSGEKDLSRNCYVFSLIEFKGDKDTFAVVIQVALPSEWEQSKSTLNEIIQSAQIRRVPPIGK